MVGYAEDPGAALGLELPHGGVESLGLKDFDPFRHVEHHAVEIVRLQVLEAFPGPLEKTFLRDVALGLHLGGEKNLLPVAALEHPADELVRPRIAFAGIDVVDAGVQHSAEYAEVLDIPSGQVRDLEARPAEEAMFFDFGSGLFSGLGILDFRFSPCRPHGDSGPGDPKGCALEKFSASDFKFLVHLASMVIRALFRIPDQISISFRLENDFGRAPAASSEVGGFEAQNMRVHPEQALDGPAEGARTLSVYDPDLIDPPAATFLKVFGDEVLDLLGPEGMEVEHPVDGDPDRLIANHVLSQCPI